jgi:hypothetical protein
MAKNDHAPLKLASVRRARNPRQLKRASLRVERLEPRCLPTAFFFSTGNPDGLMAAATRPTTTGNFEIEAADDFVLTSTTHIDQATFIGLQSAIAHPLQVVVEIYRVFPLDSNVSRTSGPPTFSTAQVPTRVNSPSDVAFTSRDSALGQLTFTTTVLNAVFTVANSVTAGGIHPKPGQTTGGNGPITAEEVQYNVTFTAPLNLAPGHYFFVPQVAINSVLNSFLWLSAPRPIVAPGTPFPAGFTDLQSWTRDAALDPDWLRIGTDIVGGTTPPTFNGAFSLSGTTVEPMIAVGADAGGGPEVKAYDGVTGALRLDFFAYESTFTGGVRVAVGDYNGDGVLDVITAPGAGRAPEVRVFDGQSGALIAHFNAYDSRFMGGLFVASADMNRDSKADIITGPDFSGGPDVRVFLSGNTSGVPDGEVLAYDPHYVGGVRVAAADFNSDGTPDVVTAPGTFSGPDIRIFDGNTRAQIGEFLAYDAHYSGGVFVATGDTNHDGTADIITGPGGSSGPELKVFNGTQVLMNPSPATLLDFFAYDPAFGGGARVAVVDTNGDGFADIVTGAGPGGGPHVRIFDGATGNQLPNPQDSFFAFDPRFSGGVFVGGQ